jgi:GNAT superfamily N-acetyltransferase
MDIHDLTPPPWSLLDPLIKESQGEGFAFLVRLKQEYLTGQERFDGPGEVLLGAFEGAELIAVCGLTRDPYSHDPTIGRVRHLFVSKGFRRRKLGRALLLEIVDRAKGRFSKLTLRTDTDRAASFYESMSFDKVSNSDSCTHQYTF